MPIEVIETRVPVVFERKELCLDSGGVGRRRGGLGQRVAFRVLADDAVTFVPASVRGILHQPPGIRGGQPGGAASIIKTDTGERLHARTPTILQRGEGVTVQTPGGGGAGDPREREVSRITDDVRLGFITPEAAQREYGVVLTRDGDVDTIETERLRRSHCGGR